MAAASSDWRLTSDHLPPNDTWVLTRQVDGTIWTGKYIRGCWRVSGKMGAVPRYKITHWTEIYQPPRENTKIEKAYRDKWEPPNDNER